MRNLIMAVLAAAFLASCSGSPEGPKIPIPTPTPIEHVTFTISPNPPSFVLGDDGYRRAVFSVTLKENMGVAVRVTTFNINYAVSTRNAGRVEPALPQTIPAVGSIVFNCSSTVDAGAYAIELLIIGIDTDGKQIKIQKAYGVR